MSVIRGHLQNVPNLNVLYEFGYFYGCLGKRRVGTIKYGKVYLPSDLGGYIHIGGDRNFRRGRALKVSARIVSSFDRKRRAQTMGLLSMGEDMGSLAGPILTGFLCTTWGIPVMFMVRVGLAVFSEIYALIVMRGLNPAARRRSSSSRGRDG